MAVVKCFCMLLEQCGQCPKCRRKLKVNLLNDWAFEKSLFCTALNVYVSNKEFPEDCPLTTVVSGTKALIDIP